MPGRFLSEGMGKVHVWLPLIGMNLAFFPMHFSGLLGMPRRIYTYPAELGVTRFNQLSTIGAFIIGIATLIFFWNLLRTRWRPSNAPANPWGGATLEWAIPSPPPVYNFTVIPIIAIGALAHLIPIVLAGAAVVIVGIYRWAYEPFEM